MPTDATLTSDTLAAARRRVEEARIRASDLVVFGPPASDVVWLASLAVAGLALREATKRAKDGGGNPWRLFIASEGAVADYDAALAALAGKAP